MVNVSSTSYGGGVAEQLSSETLLFNSLGVKTSWSAGRLGSNNRAPEAFPDELGQVSGVVNVSMGSQKNRIAAFRRHWKLALVEPLPLALPLKQPTVHEKTAAAYFKQVP